MGRRIESRNTIVRELNLCGGVEVERVDAIAGIQEVKV